MLKNLTLLFDLLFYLKFVWVDMKVPRFLSPKMLMDFPFILQDTKPSSPPNLSQALFAVEEHCYPPTTSKLPSIDAKEFLRTPNKDKPLKSKFPSNKRNLSVEL